MTPPLPPQTSADYGCIATLPPDPRAEVPVNQVRPGLHALAHSLALFLHVHPKSSILKPAVVLCFL